MSATGIADDFESRLFAWLLTTCITGDIKFSNFLKAIGYKVEGFPP